MSKFGRVLVVLVFAMSCFFLAFSFMLFISRVRWNDKLTQAQADLREQRTENTRIRDEIRRLEINRSSGNATRSNALTLLEVGMATSEEEVNKIRKNLDDLQNQKQEKGREVTGTLDRLQQERAKVQKARKDVEAVQGTRDELLEEVLDLKNQILELEAVRQRLNASESRLRTY